MIYASTRGNDMYRKKITYALVLITQTICVGALLHGANVVTRAAGMQDRRLRPNDKVVISNQSGPITVTGWDRDYIEATATNQRSGEIVLVKVVEEPKAIGSLLIAPALEGRRKNEMRLDVKIPHSARIESVSTLSGDVEITGIDAPVTIDGGSGTLRVSKVKSLNAVTGTGSIIVSEAGSVIVETIEGNVTGKDIKGDFVAKIRTGTLVVDSVAANVNLIIASGDVKVSRVDGAVRIVSISASLSVHCVKGPLVASSVNAPIIMGGIDGDIGATTTSGDIEFRGKNREGARYNLKSQSGDILFAIQPGGPGFTATLLSYSNIATDFPYDSDPSLPRSSDNRRLRAHYGDGRAQITLDSFKGSVKLIRAAPSSAKDCMTKN